MNFINWFKTKVNNEINYDDSLSEDELRGFYNLELERLFFPKKTKKNWGPNKSTKSVYPYTNEMLSRMFKKLDMADTSVLTVGSGDQALNAVYYGAKDVTIMDINPLALYYAELKINAIKNMDYKDFINYITYDNVFSHKYYRKISHLLSKDAQFFWDNAILECSGQQDMCALAKSMFQGMGEIEVLNGLNFNSGSVYSDFYKDENNYKLLQDNLKNINITYIQSSIFDIFNHVKNKKFDRIFLSNTWDYNTTPNFISLIDKYKSQLLSKNGKMQIAYFFTLKDVSAYSIYKKALQDNGQDMSLVDYYVLDWNEYYDENEFPKDSTFILNNDSQMGE